MRLRKNQKNPKFESEELVSMSRMFYKPVKMFVVRYLDEILVITSGSKMLTMDLKNWALKYLEGSLELKVDKMNISFLGMELQVVPPSVLHPPMTEKAMRARKKYLRQKEVRALELKNARERNRKKLGMKILQHVFKKSKQSDGFKFEFQIENEVREIFTTWADELVQNFLGSLEEHTLEINYHKSWLKNTGAPKSVLPEISCWSEISPDTQPDSHLELAQSFKLVDPDNGMVSRKELEALLTRLGAEPPSQEEVTMMLSEVDRNGEGCISVEALLSRVGSACDTELRETFDFFDTDHDGKITAEELLSVFSAIGDERCTLDDCRRMIDGVDKNGDGFVCFEDFSHNQIWCNVFYVLRSSGKNIRSLEEDRNMDQSDGSDWSIFKFEEIFCVQFLRAEWSEFGGSGRVRTSIVAKGTRTMERVDNRPEWEISDLLPM
ncbi:putative cox1/oxi3 intron 2 protein [Fagus crenata]